MKKLTITGCVLWILGLTASIIGMNLEGQARTWISVSGNIVFLIGLGITGYIWFRKKRSQEDTTNKTGTDD